MSADSLGGLERTLELPDLEEPNRGCHPCEPQRSTRNGLRRVPRGPCDELLEPLDRGRRRELKLRLANFLTC